MGQTKRPEPTRREEYDDEPKPDRQSSRSKAVVVGVVTLIAVISLVAVVNPWSSGSPPSDGPEQAGDVSPPPRSAFPAASSTGVPPGTVLEPSGPVVVTEPGTVVENLDIAGTVKIQASNVTVRRSRITAADYFLIEVDPEATDVLIEDVEINGRGSEGAVNSMGIIGPVTVLRSNIYGVENAIAPFSGSVLRDNYVHDLAGPGDPHYDGIQIDGGQTDIVIEHNTIDLSEHDQTSTVMIDNYFGPVSNITVKDNWLVGAGYTVYSVDTFDGGSIDGVNFVDNRLTMGQWGYASVENNSPLWSGNTDALTDEPIPAPFP